MAKLVKIVSKTGIMTVVDGVHIGAGQNTEIGGVDNPIVKNIYDNKPYIPGSSFKGKMRSSLERLAGKTSVCTCGDPSCKICTLFGVSKGGKCGVGRAIVYDMELTDEFKNKEVTVRENTHNSINRATNAAQGGALMVFEAIEKGTQFKYRVDVQVYEGDNEKELLNTVDKAIDCVESLGIGGKISSGYGHVTFSNKKTSEKVF